MATVGLALGGGGAKGLAHIAALEVIDRLGVEVVSVSGTSIGAIIGTLYASGLSASEIHEAINGLLDQPRSFEEALKSKRFFGWLELLDLELGRSHVLQAEGFVAELENIVGVDNFEDLKLPMHVIAADFWNREEVVFKSGPIMPAVSASFCLPGVFKPVVIDGKVLVDGGCVNPVPFDVIRDHSDVVIAIDVLGQREPGEDLLPSYSEALFNTFQIAEKTIVNQKMKTAAPDIYIEPAIKDVRVLEFQKSAEIFEQSAPECARLEREMKALIQKDGRSIFAKLLKR